MSQNSSLLCACVTLMVLCVATSGKKPLKEEDCEVCVNVLRKFEQKYPDVKEKAPGEIETLFKKFCKTVKDRDERFCYYIGGAETSATNILKIMSSPFKNHLPLVKVCEKLQDADPQICDLKYEKKLDLSEVEFKKLKVKDLKKILSDWDEERACRGCSEKSDFVRAVKELMPKHAPEAYAKLKARDEL
ncbi:mesencephalic astrocyte-derived neurotrophic factor homolog [Mya arenaria]|uniref:mesencephalic astrocyte-derived neurotrophic factor homolog n=1 Tax=Mya arenaria TaxID=6604 RepID=UPI0022E0C543|nr:mesencephalic astrocyte-derived neurotrophic factor homolog [Mya arenaria]XP_052779938.1 mesencephalic astrocyte-derived neurotrophic factor homolog [Mya arenaria]